MNTLFLQSWYLLNTQSDSDTRSENNYWNRLCSIGQRFLRKLRIEIICVLSYVTEMHTCASLYMYLMWYVANFVIQAKLFILTKLS